MALIYNVLLAAEPVNIDAIFINAETILLFLSSALSASIASSIYSPALNPEAIAPVAYATVDASGQDVLVDKTHDVDVVIACSHVVKPVRIACYTILSVVEVLDFSIVTAQ